MKEKVESQQALDLAKDELKVMSYLTLEIITGRSCLVSEGSLYKSRKTNKIKIVILINST